MSAALKVPLSIDNFHAEVMARGWKLLQPFRFADTDQKHVSVCLDFAEFKPNARVLDVGCGFGEFSKIAKEIRPDLDIVLLNFSEAQLSACPDGFEKHNANPHALPFEDESFDAVMFNAALGNMDCMVALAEASRVLKPDGVLFLNEPCRLSGDNEAMERILMFRAYEAEPLMAFAADMGFSGVQMAAPPVVSEYLRDNMDEEAYQAAFAGTSPMLWRFVKGDETPVAAQHGAIFARHERIALQISGGKDSLTVLHAMRPWWDRLCVYWMNPGNPFPETVELMQNIRSMVPNFVEIAGHQKEIIEQFGWPSDVVPTNWTSDGQFVFGEKPFKVQGRLDCCWRSLMLPMHERMVADGVTCIIRGKRADEKDKTPTRTGTVMCGIETVYPLWDWSETAVFDYILKNNIKIPESYDHATHSLDCMDCTAWWGENLSKYLEAKHPEHHTEYVRRIVLIKQAINEQLSECEV